MFIAGKNVEKSKLVLDEKIIKNVTNQLTSHIELYTLSMWVKFKLQFFSSFNFQFVGKNLDIAGVHAHTLLCTVDEKNTDFHQILMSFNTA